MTLLVGLIRVPSAEATVSIFVSKPEDKLEPMGFGVMVGTYYAVCRSKHEVSTFLRRPLVCPIEAEV